ncbi:Phosphoglycerate mutase-like protein AT74 [Glycine soja]
MIIGVREECRIREQDLCNFQVINETRQRFGRFFFRRRLRSRFQYALSFRFLQLLQYVEIKSWLVGFLESLWRDVDMNRLNHHPSDDLDLIIVSHGLASRVFLMKWFKWTVEQFELLNNFGNGEFRVIQLGVVEIGEYSLAVHHTDEELLEWGLSPDMVADQKRRASAGKGDWNDQYSWYLDAFFYHLPDSDDDNVDKHDETDSLSECS